AVLEIGLGGRLDAVNAVPAPVAVLTPIALDHTETLGDTIAAIAAEKADVIKPGAIAISAPQAPDALAVIAQTAAARAADLRLAPSRPTYADLRLGLIGDHQWTNAAVAIAAAEALA